MLNSNIHVEQLHMFRKYVTPISFVVINHYYGYGLLDAGRMEDMTSGWKAIKAQRQCTVNVTRRPM